jgi:hypothetical protein
LSLPMWHYNVLVMIGHFLKLLKLVSLLDYGSKGYIWFFKHGVHQVWHSKQNIHWPYEIPWGVPKTLIDHHTTSQDYFQLNKLGKQMM